MLSLPFGRRTGLLRICLCCLPMDHIAPSQQQGLSREHFLRTLEARRLDSLMAAAMCPSTWYQVNGTIIATERSTRVLGANDADSSKRDRNVLGRKPEDRTYPMHGHYISG